MRRQIAKYGLSVNASRFVGSRGIARVDATDQRGAVVGAPG